MSRKKGLPATLLLCVALATGGTTGPATGATKLQPKVAWETPVTATDLAKRPANNSPMLASHPDDPRLVVLANRLDAPEFGCSLQVSTNGGRLWKRVTPVPKLPRGAEKCYAPEVAFDSKGVLHFLFVGLAGEGNSPVGAYLATSSDRARTFTAPLRVLGPERYMVRMAIDRSGEHRGRIHLVWLQAGADPPLGGLAPPPNPIMHSFSDDGGKKFSRPVKVAGSKEERVVAPALALGPKGEVHVLFYDLQDDARDYQGLEGPAWEGKWSLELASSFDGGRRFRRQPTVDDGIVPPERVMLIFTMPPASLATGRSGRLYAAWHDARNGDWDILSRRSTDGGRSWQGPQRINDDPQGNGRHQYLPRLSVSPNGRVDAVFYDRRNDPENIRNDVYYSSLSNNGASFSPNLRLSSESSHSRIGQRYEVPSAKDMVEFGSRLASVSTGTGMLASWTDTRNHLTATKAQDIVAARVSLSR
ncbi:MAG: sialidase family protein [Actinomycetota bacterium]